MSIYILLIFAAYILFDYFTGNRNKYKLLFLIPILMSALMLTDIPSKWPAEIFVVYRVVLILSCFVLMTAYLRDIGRRKRELEGGKKKKNKK